MLVDRIPQVCTPLSLEKTKPALAVGSSGLCVEICSYLPLIGGSGAPVYTSGWHLGHSLLALSPVMYRLEDKGFVKQ